MSELKTSFLFLITFFLLSSCELRRPSTKISQMEKDVIIEVAVQLEENQAQFGHYSSQHYKTAQNTADRDKKGHNTNSINRSQTLSSEMTNSKKLIAIIGLVILVIVVFIMLKFGG